eukprot:5730155-Amphidinium_carterae.1
MGTLMSDVEANLSENYQNANLSAQDATCSTNLYYVLLLVGRQQPLTMVVNAGDHEGLTAWQRVANDL